MCLPFLFVLTRRRLRPRARPFPGGRWCGVRVKVFSIGFGRNSSASTTATARAGASRWIPLGGYVKFLDDENAASVPDREARADDAGGAQARRSSPSRGRARGHRGRRPDRQFPAGDRDLRRTFFVCRQQVLMPRVDSVVAGSAAESAGFKPAIWSSSIDGQQIEAFTDMQRIVSASADETLAFTSIAAAAW